MIVIANDIDIDNCNLCRQVSVFRSSRNTVNTKTQKFSFFGNFGKIDVFEKMVKKWSINPIFKNGSKITVEGCISISSFQMDPVYLRLTILRRLPPLTPPRGDPTLSTAARAVCPFFCLGLHPPVPQQSRPTKWGVYILSKLLGLT